MCQMDIDINNQNEQTTVLIVSIYAVDAHGICHEMFDKLQTLSIDTEEKMDEKDISKSIVIVSNQIDNVLQPINEDLALNSSNCVLADYLSTQPFSILDLHENSSSSLQLFNNDTSTPILCPPSQLSGQVVSRYQNNSLRNSHIIVSKTKKKKKKKKKLCYRSRRFTILKKQLKAYLKKKKKKQQRQDRYQFNNVSSSIIPHQSEQIESTPIERSMMIDFQLSPDLSKRKYIYKDITLSNNHQNQMNWRIFQYTQQPSSMSCIDQSITSDRDSRPFHFINDPISLPDIRIGLSRHRSIKQLHKLVLE